MQRSTATLHLDNMTYRMKKIALTAFFSLTIAHSVTIAQGTWVQKTSLLGPARTFAIAFSINGFGYVGLGMTGLGNPSFNDFWQYNPTSDSWTQMANFGGGVKAGAVSFVIANYGYVATGTGPSGPQPDVWQYDPSSNSWTQKNNFPGYCGSYASSFSIGPNGYFGGSLLSTKADFWSYNSTLDSWTIKDSIIGGRGLAIGFSLNGYGYIGTGQGLSTYYNDLWKYDPTINQWTQMASMPASGRAESFCFTIGNRAYVGTGTPWVGSTSLADVWEYNPSNNTWTQQANFGGGQKEAAIGFSIACKGYVFGGFCGDNSCGSPTNELWEFTPDTCYTESVFETNFAYALTLSPNPFSTQTTLRTDRFFKNASLTVYNSFGQTVKCIDNLTGQTITLTRDNLPSGQYFVRLTQDNKVLAADKLVITDK